MEKDKLELLLEEAKSRLDAAMGRLPGQAQGTPLVKTEEGRFLLSMQVRLIETLLHGEPKTAMPSRHHS